MVEEDDDKPITVRLDISIQVDLPEGCTFETDENDEEQVSQKSKERAIEAAISALPQNIQLFIDGEDKPAARIYIEASDDDVTEVYCDQ